jgi:predicted ATP-binding protein involved in virulence
MIDELDLHLHPTWQRHVVSDLKRAFPNIQFVVTTHSPFIVQSLKSDELVILDEEINKQGDPFKKSLEEVAANEMGVEDIPRSQEFMEMQKVAEEYYKLVSEGRSSQNDQRVRQLRERLNKLEEKFSEDAAL